MKEKMKNVMSILQIPFRFARSYSILHMIFILIVAISPSIVVLATSKFIQNIILFVKSQASISSIILYAIIIIIGTSIDWTSGELNDFIISKIQYLLRQNYRPMLVDKRCKLKYSYIENNDAWDLITRVSTDTEKKCADAYGQLLVLCRIIINIICLLAIIANSSLLAALLIVVISIPLFFIAIKLGNKLYDAEKEATKFERRYKYLSEVLTSREYAGERTLFKFSKKISDRWQAQYNKGTKVRIKAEFFATSVNFISGSITVVITTIILVILICLVKNGAIAVGLCVALTEALNNVIQTISWNLSDSAQNVSKGAEFYGDLHKFFAMEEKGGALEKPNGEKFVFDKLEFKNVTFKYPNTDRYILKNISFTIEKNKHYALVGVNGCGKTTISKLISGLYDNYEGEILLNGKELRTYTLPTIKDVCSIVFQDFAKYNITLRDNVMVGNINLTDDVERKYRFNQAVDTIKLDNVIDKLSDKADTYLGKIKENGVDLSGGEWQRVAIARSIVSDCPIKILDEPTAALDPISESLIYEEFEKISHNDTTIFISHRLGSTKLANTILVIDDGRIKEKGSHDELMKLDGIYAGMYNSQRSWYL